jgi:manganese transport protein
MVTADKPKMGALVAPRWMTALSGLVAALIIHLNMKLLWDFVAGL